MILVCIISDYENSLQMIDKGTIQRMVSEMSEQSECS